MDARWPYPSPCGSVELPRAGGSALRRRNSRARALPRWTFDPAVLLQLGKVMLEALVLGLRLLGLSVLCRRPCLRICLRLRLCLCLRLCLRLGLRLGLRLLLRLLGLVVNFLRQVLLLRASGR